MPQGSPADSGSPSLYDRVDLSTFICGWDGGVHMCTSCTQWIGQKSLLALKEAPFVLDTYYRRHYKSLKTLLTHFEFLVLIPCLWASCETLLWFGHKLPPSHCWLDFGVEEMFLIGLELTISLTQVLVPSYLSQPDSSLAFRNDFFPERKCIS